MAEGKGWATGVLLAVTAIPREQRALVQQLIEKAGGSYSPNLSRRCTHLAVPLSALEAGAGCSDKLRSVLRHRHKWDLQLVDLRWVLECMKAGRRLGEAAFYLQADWLAVMAAATQEQAPPNASADRQQASWAAASKGTGSSMLAADTFHPHALEQGQHQNHRQEGPFPAATMAAGGGAGALTQPDACRRSVNSYPFSSFPQPQPQPAASMQTQSPSVKHSMQRSVGWGGAESEAGLGPSQPNGTSQMAAAAALPAQVERLLHHEDASSDAGGASQPDYFQLPMTQPGFMPAADLLEQLRASTATGRQSSPQHSERRVEQPQPEAQQLRLASGKAAVARSWSDAQSPMLVPQHPREGLRGLPGASATASAAGALPPSGSAHPVTASKQQRQQVGGMSTAELLQQLRLSARGAASRSPPPAKEQRPAPVVIEALWQQLQASAGVSPAAPPQQPQQPSLAIADLLGQLRASATGATAAVQQHRGRVEQQQQAAVPNNELLRHLQALPPGPAVGLPPQQCQQNQWQQTQSTAELLAQMQQHSPAMAGRKKQGGMIAAASAATSTADLLEQLRAAPAAPDPAAAGQLAAQLKGLSYQCQQQQLASALAAGTAAGIGSMGGLRSADELLLLLCQQQQPPLPLEPPAGAVTVRAGAEFPAASPMAAVGNNGRSVTEGLLLQVQHLAQHDSFTPLKQQQHQEQSPPPAAQQQQLLQHTVTSEDAEPPAKYRRQDATPSPEAAPAPAEDAHAAPGITSAVATMAVVSCSTEEPPAASPASSAGSPAVQAGSVQPKAAAGVASSRLDTPELHAASSQVSDSGAATSVFVGMLAIVDASLSPQEQQCMAAAVEKGGGRVTEGSGLCRGITHVVCQPERALKWLSMGVGIVSPQWVLQSLRSGRQQRCLTMSADASRHLPAAAAAAAASPPTSGKGQPAGQAGIGSSRQLRQEALSSELLSSKEARQQMLSQLAGAVTGLPGSGVAVPRAALAESHQTAAAPAELLSGLLWSILDPPSAARLGGQQHQQAVPMEELDALIVPDSEEEEEEASLCCVTASQACVEDLLQQAAAPCWGKSGSGDNHRTATATAASQRAWQEAVVLRGVAQLTLLLPRDARGELGLDTYSVPLAATAGGTGGAQAQRQLTAAQLLALVHGYYQEQISCEEQLQLLQSFPAAQGVAAALRPAFLELLPVARGALLGPRCSFEGLRKATREPAGAVYELQLGS